MAPPSVHDRNDPEPEGIELLRAQVLGRARGEGFTALDGPDLCLYRFSRPATLTKVATFGVTLGVVLQGTKELRVEGHELSVAPPNLLVVTRETENATVLSPAGPDRQAMQFIRAHAAEGLTVPAIARRVAMSPSHFAHRFRAVARVSPMRYLRDVRLEQARARLLGGSARVGEVARDLGYESQAHFAREFKLRYGAPPTQYVERVAKV